MAATHPDKTQAKSDSTSKATGQNNAISLLKQDHREVERMFRIFQGTRDPERQAELAEQICTALKVHSQIEEELFYPVAREEIGDPELVEEAIVEHMAAKELIAQIEQMEPEEELFEARMQVLSEQIHHHVEEEETELFPRCEKAGMDLDRIGRQLADRKQQLMANLSGPRAH